MDDIKPVAQVVRVIPCDEMGDQWYEVTTPVSLEPKSFLYDSAALLQAREEGRREGMREAAEICEKEGWKLGIPLHHSEPLIAAITRAAEGK